MVAATDLTCTAPLAQQLKIDGRQASDGPVGARVRIRVGLEGGLGGTRRPATRPGRSAAPPMRCGSAIMRICHDRSRALFSASAAFRSASSHLQRRKLRH